MGLGSKTLNKIDESAKEFIMNLLENDQTHGFDVDSIYYTNKGWIIPCRICVNRFDNSSVLISYL